MAIRSAVFRWTCVALFLPVTVFAVSQSAPEREPRKDQETDDRPTELPDKTQLFMRAKLASSQKVMEGLVTENFELIRDGAKQMKKISEAAHWPKTIDEVYQHYSVSFRKQCDKLEAQADRRDLEAAHYTHLHMSTTCIDCHSYVRRRFKVNRETPGGPIQLIPTHWDRDRRIQPPQPDDG